MGGRTYMEKGRVMNDERCIFFFEGDKQKMEKLVQTAWTFVNDR